MNFLGEKNKSNYCDLGIHNKLRCYDLHLMIPLEINVWFDITHLYIDSFIN